MTTQLFNNGCKQQSAWTKETTHQTRYKNIDGKWYNYCDLEFIVGQNEDGSLAKITNYDLAYFTEEASENFYSISQK